MSIKENQITISTKIGSAKEKVWEFWTRPEHIVNWNFASDEWHCPSAVNELKPGGRFSWRMEAKDGSMGFDYSGKYGMIETNEIIKLTLEDGRKVSIEFHENDGLTEVIETFEPDANDLELQKQGWQAILDNFKSYVELHK